MKTLKNNQPKEVIEYIAKNTLELKSSHNYLSYFSLIWKGNYKLLSFNSTNNEIISILNDVDFEEEDFNELENIVISFLSD